MAEEKIVVLGIGNILRRDEGVGVRLVERLMREYSFPPRVAMYDGGTTGMMGLLPIMEEADRLIVLDAVNGPGEPGSVYRYTLDDFRLTIPKKISAHDVGLIECIAISELKECAPGSVTVIGVKPEDINTDSMELSPTVSGSMDAMMDALLAELRALGVEPSEKTPA